MNIVNVCVRHTKEGEEIRDEDYDGFSIEIDDENYATMIADFSRNTDINDETGASAVELILEIARMDEENQGEREEVALCIACAVLRETLARGFGEEEIGDAIITVMDETDVGGDIAVWVNDEGEDAKFYVKLGDAPDVNSAKGG